MNEFIVIRDLVKTYQTGNVQFSAIDGMSFTIEEGKFVVIVGPSGAGKTTLLNLLGGMDVPTSGEIQIDNVKLNLLTKKQLVEYRRTSVGFVFQFYNLMPNLTALENVELATEICKDAYEPKKILISVGLEEHMNNFPSQLSGGEQQRVSIARAVAKNPRLLLCDEPTGALDYKTGKLVLKLLFDICKKEKKTVIVVTHNMALKDMADQTIFIKNGKTEKIVFNDNPKRIEDIEW